MSYNREQLVNIIRKSVEELIDEQPILFLAETNVNERTISSELSQKIRHRIKDYHVNCEYNRMVDEHGTQLPKRIHLDPNHSNPSLVYPDIIIHRQENGLNNVLVLELKMSWKNHLKNEDLVKLERYIEELNYQYGVYLELSERGISELKWFTNYRKQKSK